jgi:hypothetical protein
VECARKGCQAEGISDRKVRVPTKPNYPRVEIKYNIEKINKIGKLLAEVVEEAAKQTEAESVRISKIEMALRENLLTIVSVVAN